jgi:phosphocarrier protein HPr
MLESPVVLIIRCQVMILNALGLHLRAADKFVRLAQQFVSEIRVHHDAREVNGKSIIDLITLAAECGTQLGLEARGYDAEAALVALAKLVSARFHEGSEEETAAGEVRVFPGPHPAEARR